VDADRITDLFPSDVPAFYKPERRRTLTGMALFATLALAAELLADPQAAKSAAWLLGYPTSAVVKRATVLGVVRVRLVPRERCLRH
jgi:hypothetical protein